MIADGSDAATTVVALGHASRIVSAAGAEVLALRLGRRTAPIVDGSAQAAPPLLERVVLIPRVWYNPDLKSRWFYLPAILAMVLMLTTMILPSMAVVREKEIGTLEQIIVTPIRSWQLIIGKRFPFAAMGVLVLLLVTP